MSTTVARRYTYGLFSYADEHGIVDVVDQGLQFVAETLKQHPDFGALIQHPLIAADAKAKMMEEVFGGYIDPIALRFIKLLLQRGRSEQLIAVVDDFHTLAQEERGLVEVQVESAMALTDEQVSALEQALSTVLNKQARAVVTVNPDLIAGYRARVGNRVIDATVQAAIGQFDRNLLHGALFGAGL